MWPPSQETISSTKAALSVAASLAATAVLLRSITTDLIPESLYNCVQSNLYKLSNRLSSKLTVIIEEHNGLAGNQMFAAANVYLGSKLSPPMKKLKVYKPQKEENLQVCMDKDQELCDYYKNVKLKWVLVSMINNNVSSNNLNKKRDHSVSYEVRYFEVTFHKKHLDMVLGSYFPYILQKAKDIEEEKKSVKLHTIDYNGTDYWNSIVLNHPSTFDSIAMEPEIKGMLLEDLNLFLGRKEYYKRVGKAWKRGYLLYGPPGTGKSSLIAAMANYLRFDIYDLDLKEVQCNSDLRRLLIGTGSKSILVIEDIDCSLQLHNREDAHGTNDDDKVTLSGLLNFIDGLWSSCGEERIVICTTNHKERLDPALLRPGRMDLHIHMSYCSFTAFKTLASNYLGIQNHHHPMFDDIQGLLDKVNATPAEVAGELMKSENVDIALKGLINFLQSKLPQES
ncbi:AAA-ATPase At3g50940-like isoform X2 [Arachis ipaensis]|uniref:AAA-ATPase At3g50940-like isoform X2 n=1 Tax=Arachis ipaensis TaxID=130454 RepID=UPI000A2B2875|nr:AAA-ATPase At3g50940-like isoform X2 [Arachis ipaensis]